MNDQPLPLTPHHRPALHLGQGRSWFHSECKYIAVNASVTPPKTVILGEFQFICMVDDAARGPKFIQGHPNVDRGTQEV